MLKQTIVSCAAIMMLLGQNPALGNPPKSHAYEQFADDPWENTFCSKSPPPQEDYPQSKAEKFRKNLEEPFKKMGKMLSKAGKKLENLGKNTLFCCLL